MERCYASAPSLVLCRAELLLIGTQTGVFDPVAVLYT